MEAAEQTEVYPPPPPWFRLYGKGIGTERLLPPPPPPVIGDYQMFGMMESTAAGVPPLSVKQLFSVKADGGVDFKAELVRLNRELLTTYLALMETLIYRPSSYGREVEAISTIIRNMHYLLNYLRCHQARASLEFILQTETQDRLAAIADLRERRRKAEAKLLDLAETLRKIGSSGGAANEEAEAMNIADDA